jgi:hypothetical protein
VAEPPAASSPPPLNFLRFDVAQRQVQLAPAMRKAAEMQCFI